MKSPKTERMERAIRNFMKRNEIIPPEHFNSLMRYDLVDCNYEERTICLAYDIVDWMQNPIGSLHGGIICAAFDITMGTLAVVLSEMHTPTIQMSVNFTRPIPMGERMLVYAKAHTVGKTIVSLTSEAVCESTGKVAATASGTFYPGSGRPAGGLFAEERGEK